MKKQKLIIEGGNNGDMSVGIYPLKVKITIEANVDLKDVLSEMNYRCNKILVEEDIEKLLLWIDDTKSYIEDIRIEEK